MKKTIIAILLGILLIGTFGAAVVSAVTSNDSKASYGCGYGFMHRWGARNTDSEYSGGNFSYCPYYNSSRLQN